MSYGDNPGGGPEYDDSRQALGIPPGYPYQPGYGQPGPTPPAYRAWAIIAIICAALFNLILGLPTALLGRRYGREVPLLWASGDVQGALRASRRARAWLIASSVLDVLGLILLAVLVTQTSSSNFNNPSVVAASIKRQVQQRISDRTGPDYDPGVSVASVTCTSSGTNTDRCVIRLSDGSTVTKTATISGGGTGYSTN
jgi:Interferon-induced transmembrane protein